MLAALIAAVALTLAGLVFSSPAAAITRDQANRVAVRALGPQLPARGEFILFGLRRPIARGSAVFAARLGPRRRTVQRTRALPAKRWLFLLDRRPGALFPRRGALTMLLVSDRTGRVTMRQTTRSVPMVNRRPARFLRSPGTYWDRRNHVRRRLRRPAPSAGVAALTRPLAGPAQSPFDPLIASRLRQENDCVLAMGAGFIGSSADNDSATAVWRFWDRLRIPSREVRGGGDELERAVRKVVADGCHDVFIYLAGSGHPPPAPASVTTEIRIGDISRLPPRVGGRAVEHTIKAETKSVGARTLNSIIRTYSTGFGGFPGPRATFKVKIDASFSGRFVPVLNGLPNLRLLETSSAAGEQSYGPVANANGRFPHNPRRLLEFTNGELAALQSLMSNQQEVERALEAPSFLAWLLKRSGEESGRTQPRGEVDRAQQRGLTHPQIQYRE